MDEHACQTPATGEPGELWACPDCGRTWRADRLATATILTVVWCPLIET